MWADKKICKAPQQWYNAVDESMYMPSYVYLWSNWLGEYCTGGEFPQNGNNNLIAIMYDGEDSLGTHYVAPDPNSDDVEYYLYEV